MLSLVELIKNILGCLTQASTVSALKRFQPVPIKYQWHEEAFNPHLDPILLQSLFCLNKHALKIVLEAHSDHLLI